MLTKQRSFFEITNNLSDKSLFKSTRIFGGSLAKGKRKLQRPISTKRWMHLTLKASCAKGQLSMLNAKYRLKIDKIIRTIAKQNFINIKDGVNMGNHIHLQIKCKNREHFQKFLRVITGKIAMLVTGAKKGKSFGKRFWDELAYSRIVTTQFEERQLVGYFKANKIEREKGYQARLVFLDSFNKLIRYYKKNQQLGMISQC